jgi:hypothetical protein
LGELFPQLSGKLFPQLLDKLFPQLLGQHLAQLLPQTLPRRNRPRWTTLMGLTSAGRGVY